MDEWMYEQIPPEFHRISPPSRGCCPEGRLISKAYSYYQVFSMVTYLKLHQITYLMISHNTRIEHV